MNGWFYAALCVIVPIAWGMIVVRATAWVEERLARRRRSEGRNAPTDREGISPEYHI
ncbi:MAG: hypothetical protein SFU56_16000 [Capsulimonadales bacterium]|nr:hypothetical protein [Capsulimonadales bacterium]